MKVNAVATLSRRDVVSEYLASMAASKAASDPEAKDAHWQQAATLWLGMTPDEQEEARWLSE